MLAALLSPSVTQAGVDPLLAAAVEFHTVEIRKTYDERKSLQEKIIEADAVITLQLDRMHNVENQILDYMSNASAAVENMYQLKEIALTIPEIYQAHQDVLDAIKRNPKGLVFAAIVSKQWTKIAENLTQSAMLINDLVLTGKTDKNNKKKVNLLSAAERYDIVNTVLYNLKRVRYSLWLLSYQIRYWTFIDFWIALDYKSWAKMIGMEYNAKLAIRMWNRTFSSDY